MNRKRIQMGILVIALIFAFGATASAVDLNVPLIYQETGVWCWAAASQMAVWYYGPTPEQCEIVNWAFNETSCCLYPNSTACYSGNWVTTQDGCLGILLHWGVNAAPVYSYISETEVESEINAGDPFLLHFRWTAGGGHVLTGVGYDYGTLTIHDPWYGTLYYDYGSAVSASDHWWEETVTTDGMAGGADFSATPTWVAPGGTVQFTDKSTGNSTSWSWTFPGGTPSTSTTQNPPVTYRTLGVYDVTLAVSDAQGTHTTTKPGYITVSADPAPLVYCDSASTSCEYEWIESVQIDAFNNTSAASTYTDFTNQTVTLNSGTSAQVTLTPGFQSWSDTEYWKIWIDWNKNGDFGDAGEEVFSDFSETAVSGTITVPASASGTSTRMRVSMSFDAAPSMCGSSSYGEVEDYTVVIR